MTDWCWCLQSNGIPGACLQDSGLLAAGYTYITLGGMGFAENGDPEAVPGYPNIPRQNITRNATGHLQVDPSRFPGPGSTPACLDETTVYINFGFILFWLFWTASHWSLSSG